VQGALISEGPKTFDGVFAECCTRCRALGNKDSASVKPRHSAAVSQVPCNTRRTFSEKIINKLPDRSHPVGRACSLVSSPLWCPESHAVAGAPGSCAAAGCRGLRRRGCCYHASPSGCAATHGCPRWPHRRGCADSLTHGPWWAHHCGWADATTAPALVAVPPPTAAPGGRATARGCP
jgi:hypothetical protein